MPYKDMLKKDMFTIIDQKEASGTLVMTFR